MADTFRRALELLGKVPRTQVCKRSSDYHTQPVGADAGTAFLNAAAHVQTGLEAEDLLTELQAIENQLGRVRTVHWGPRTLDLDLLLYGEQCLKSSRLTVPHPHLWYRRFVLDPLAEIAPALLHPRLGLTVLELQTRLLARPLPCSLHGGDRTVRHAIVESLTADFPEVSFLAESDPAAWLQFEFSASQASLAKVGRGIPLNDDPGLALETVRQALRAALDQPQRQR